MQHTRPGQLFPHPGPGRRSGEALERGYGWPGQLGGRSTAQYLPCEVSSLPLLIRVPGSAGQWDLWAWEPPPPLMTQKASVSQCVCY